MSPGTVKSGGNRVGDGGKNPRIQKSVAGDGGEWTSNPGCNQEKKISYAIEVFRRTLNSQEAGRGRGHGTSDPR